MSELTINTTQNVKINFQAASVGERILAYFVDLLIKGSYLVVIGYFVFNKMGLGDAISKMDQWSAIAIVVLFLFPYMFYSLVLESILEGQTIGKRLIRIKVVKIDGYQASFPDYLLRWLFRIIDISLSSGIIGVVSTIINEKNQRLGDVSAGTAVITLKNKFTINSTILEDIGEAYVPVYPLVIKLSDNDVRIIKETLNTAIAKSDFEMISKLKEKVEKVTGIKNQSGKSEDFLKTVIKDYNFYTQNM
ncbi:RDD family protein [Flavobacterium sp.]|uniref:RDD family protein n=1 Tax=Flavobacterium sp. TaxID=239 RepID=UPI002626D4D2|nr:RDD family protein [Flavobacterium sp.]